MESYTQALKKTGKIKRPSNPVFTALITEDPRPWVNVAGCITAHRPYDWSVFGFDDCKAEMERRRSIHDLMTEHERKVFAEYCRLRDEFKVE